MRYLLTLLEHVAFGLVVGDARRHRGLLAILGVVVGVLINRVAVGLGCHACESCRRALLPDLAGAVHDGPMSMARLPPTPADMLERAGLSAAEAADWAAS